MHCNFVKIFSLDFQLKQFAVIIHRYLHRVKVIQINLVSVVWMSQRMYIVHVSVVWLLDIIALVWMLQSLYIVSVVWMLEIISLQGLGLLWEMFLWISYIVRLTKWTIWSGVIFWIIICITSAVKSGQWLNGLKIYSLTDSFWFEFRDAVYTE